jgi:hypothetical protein
VRVTLVAGMAQQGKTTLALRVAALEARRLIVLDPTRSTALATVPGVPSWTILSRWLVTPGAQAPRWAVALRSDDPADYAELLRHLKYLRHATVLVDEVLTFTSDPEALPWLVRAARTSAHYGGGTGLSLLMTAQRPMDAPRDVRSQITRLFMFQTREPGDLEWIARYTQDPDLAAQVAGLAPHQFLEHPATLTSRRLSHGPVILDGRARGGGIARAVPARAADQHHQQAAGAGKAEVKQLARASAAPTHHLLEKE